MFKFLKDIGYFLFWVTLAFVAFILNTCVSLFN
jgi:hypothetical protein